MQLLTAPKYFNLKETAKGTVLVNCGVWKKEEISEKYGNLQHYFQDEDGVLKCISGGSANYIIDMHKLRDGHKVKITYNGSELVSSGDFKGKSAHQFIFELVEPAIDANKVKEVQDKIQAENQDLNDLA